MRNKAVTKYIEIVAITAVLFITFICFGRVWYATDDDIVMNLIAAGACGEPSQYLVYIDITLGYIFKFLYGIYGGINWYLWFFLAFNFLTQVLICIMLTEKMDHVWTGIVTVLVELLLSKIFYWQLQFTQHAAVYFATGSIFLLWYLMKGKKNVFPKIIAIIMMVLGFSIRFKAAVAVVPMVLAAVVFCYKKLDKKQIVWLCIPAAMVIVLFGSNHYVYHNDPGWDQYLRAEKVITEKLDLGNYNYGWDEEEYLAAGFVQEDFQLLESWQYNDPEYFTAERMEKMAEIGKDHRQDKLRADKDVVVNAGKGILFDLQTQELVIAFFVVLILTIVAAVVAKDRKGLLCSAAILLLILGEIYYLACLRRIAWRAEVGLWYSGLFILAVFVLLPDAYEVFGKVKGKVVISSRASISKTIAVAATLCVVFIWQRGHLDFTTFAPTNYSEESLWSHGEIQKIHDSEGFFVVGNGDLAGVDCGILGVFEITKDNYAEWYSNIAPAGGWIANSPIGNYYANLNGITSPFRAIVDRDDVYYVGYGEDMGYVLVYLQKHYGENIGVYQAPFEDFKAFNFYRTE